MTTDITDWRFGSITDEAVAELRAQVGIPSPLSPWNSTASADAIWHFALGVGDDNPLWWDSSYAANTRWERMFGPPTFLYSCHRGGPENGKPSLGLDEYEVMRGTLGLWSSDRWIWRSHTWRDEQIHSTGELHEVRENPSTFSGRSVALVHKTRFFGEDSRLIAELFKTVIRFERPETRSRGKYLDIPAPHYSEEDLKALHDQYEREPEQRRGSQPLYWEDVDIGNNMIRLVKGPLTMTTLVGWQQGWGSLLCQTNRIAYQVLRDYPGNRLFNPETGIEDTLAGGHWDPYFTAQGGMPRGYDFGGMRISWLSHLLTDWAGDDAFVAELDARLLRPNFLGDTTWLGGVVREKRERFDAARGEIKGPYGAVVCELTATNQRNEITASATAEVALPRRSN